MNTLRAFQGTDTAFSVTLSPATVDFAGGPALVADVHRGDGRAPVATVTATWTNTATDLITVVLPGTVSADIPPGNYLLSVRLADETAYLSLDALVVYPSTAGTAPLRSLIAPSDAIGVIPEIKGDLGQFDGLTWLLESAATACEAYCDRKFVLADYDQTWPYEPWSAVHYLNLEHPVASIAAVSVGSAGWPIVAGDYTTTTRYDLDTRTGQLRVDSSSWGDTGFITGRPAGRLIRVVYRAGYAIDPTDVALGVPPVPKDLQSACLMVAIAIRESAKTAGPTQQQGITGASGGYYTKNINETAIPAPARAILDRYARQWGVA